ncbi:hypothetical protein pdul_cds_493 [Pandoravirus dulcis]|uniref:Uncharacterized protein n=1 Tax=Pandoravirus dulcis TaxID=1349409 RepID=S4VT46_9VIRU|nr:hypothetical protein pdul_cds_493 [Pandoravirus dulcis]AGO82575.1 hypothetical protein pdul_cds_493 [Pandoravirus dulcis]
MSSDRPSLAYDPYDGPFPAWAMRGGMWLMNATSKFYTGVDLFDAETPTTPPAATRSSNNNGRHRPNDAAPAQH